ncbi:hypothetical protein K474DRAFT_1610534 [Panus rudis PR-1116 ss-1]|nr:hypothetical protein K474DRAFT_1610534 [Panus rudis PR-1116 ss-1]
MFRFSYHRSLISPSHSSCPLSFNIVNLPLNLRYVSDCKFPFDYFLKFGHGDRYKAANLILVGVLPGPQEQDGDQIQYFLHYAVEELIPLWKDGVRVVTRKYPAGRLIRVILVAVICDKPAAHKIAAYGAHSHTFFCTLCWIEKSKLGTDGAFAQGQYRAQTDAEHRRLQAEYKTKTTKAARTQFVKLYATRWSELSRLPYFDFSRMVVVDPMHNLFLGELSVSRHIPHSVFNVFCPID